MRIHAYRDYGDYIQAQVETSKQNSDGQWASKEDIEFVSKYLNFRGSPKKGICHGVKQGNENQWFNEFTGAEVLGTDINVSSDPNTIQWDFNEVKEEWIDSFDFIYSNAFDHTCVPEVCLKRWMSCLKEKGICVLEWTVAHSEIYSNRSDPFGASIEEYTDLIKKCGFHLTEILEFREKKYLIIEHKDEFVILCDGGLGNRIGTLIGGIVIAEQINKEPVICWPVNTWCGCFFKDLYQTDLKVISKGIRELFKEKIDHTFMIHENQVGFIYPYEVPLSLDGISKLNRSAVYYNNCVPSFLDNVKVNNVLADIKINSDVFRRVESFCRENNISDKVIGVHIRKTDGGQRIQEDNIVRYIKNTQGVRVFVCSDEKETEDKFKGLSGVTVFPKTEYAEKKEEGGWNKETIDSDGRLNRSNVKRSRVSIIEAFIDLLILSNTTINHGTSSSFFKLAKRYENIRRSKCR